MYNYMKDHAKEVLMEDNYEAIEKVQREKYAFFMESSSIEYNIQRICNITQIGGLLDSKSYGIAIKKGWWFNDNIAYRSNNGNKLLCYCHSRFGA